MTSILFPNHNQSRQPKLHVSAGTLQPFTDPKQAPTKKAPWRQIREVPFIAAVTISLPLKFYDAIWDKVAPMAIQTRYFKVFMSLEDILTGDFFNQYIKVGNIMMISEGQPGVDNLFTLSEGILRLDLGKEDYQRAGLQGVVSKNHGGRKHTKERYIVEYNLRAASMVKGKNGFDRLMYAARKVLNASKVWLFRDLMPSLQTNEAEAPIMKHHPTIIHANGPQTDELEHVAVPDMVSTPDPENITHTPSIIQHEVYYELTEWFDLVGMKSPRVQRYDRPDPYISRYTPPGMNHGEPPPSRPIPIKILRWTGLIDPEWIKNLQIELIKHSRNTKSKGWLAMTVNAHPTQALGQVDGYTILLQSSSHQRDNNTNTKLEDQPVTAATIAATAATTTNTTDTATATAGTAESHEHESKMEVDDNEDDNNPAHQHHHQQQQQQLQPTPIPADHISSAATTSGLQRFMCFQFVDS